MASFSSRLEQLPQAVPLLLQALDYSLGEPTRVVVTGEPARVEVLPARVTRRTDDRCQKRKSSRSLDSPRR